MAAKGSTDWEWRLELTRLVTEVHTNQGNLDKKLDSYIKTSSERLSKLRLEMSKRGIYSP